MRTLALAAALALAPAASSAQLAPRSVAFEAGIARRIGPEDLLRSPVAISAAWWIGDALDFTARVGWASATRTEVRAVDAAVELAAGLRRAFGSGRVRPSIAGEVGVQRCGGAALVRTRAGAALDAFVARDLAAGIGATAGALLPSGGGGVSLELAVALHLEVYFR